ncbi:MAG: hypothetical protein K0R39_3056 [Symbiobacteriaceae bacterium]|jgi:hypothetical protein|nr:hypothetical protein [Symbiobacteriaceae bacterium]
MKKVLVSGLTAAGLILTATASLSAPVKAPPAAPAAAPALAASLAPAEKLRLQEQLEGDGRIQALSGPRTLGALVSIGGRKIQLPADAFIAKFVVGIDCMPGGPCPDELPFLILARGQSQVWVGPRTGRIFHERTAPGHDQAFAFLREVTQP